MVGGLVQLQLFFFFCFNKTTDLGRNCGSLTCLQPAFFRRREELHFSRNAVLRHFSMSGFSTFLPGCDFHSKTQRDRRCCGDDGCPQVQRHRTEPRPQHTQAAIVLLQDTLRLYFSVGDLSGFSSPGRPPTQQIYEPPSPWNVDKTLQLCDKEKTNRFVC